MKGDLTVVWLDLANTYGTVPHKLIETALENYHIPEKIARIVRNYLERFISDSEWKTIYHHGFISDSEWKTIYHHGSGSKRE